jgi:invasion protein IalB
MKDFRLNARALPLRRALGFGTLFTLALGMTGALAQTPPAATPAAAPPAAPKAVAPKPAVPPKPQAAPAAKPPATAAAPSGAPASAEGPPLIYSPWTKVCGPKDAQSAPNAKDVCFTVKEARLDTGQFLGSAALLELEGDQKKLFRVILPLGLQLRPGTRMVFDQNPLMGQFAVCFPNGCLAEFEFNPDLVGRLKKSPNLVLQAHHINGQVVSYSFPLGDFAKANEGPPTDPKALEEQQKKLQDELQRRAEEARKRLEQQGGPQAGAVPPR